MKRKIAVKALAFLASLAVAFAGIPLAASGEENLNFNYSPIAGGTELEISDLYYSDGVKDIVVPATAEYNGKTLPVTSVGADSFSSGMQVDTVTIPKSVLKIGDRAFCGFMTKKYIVDEENPNYKSVDGVLFTKDGKTLIQYPLACENEEYNVPEGTEEIGEFSFSKAYGISERNVSSVILPKSVRTIGAYAFYDSGCIRSISISEGVTYIGDGAFGRSSIDSVVLPSTLKSVGKSILKSGATAYVPKNLGISLSCNTVEIDPIKRVELVYDKSQSVFKENTHCYYVEKDGKKYPCYNPPEYSFAVTYEIDGEEKTVEYSGFEFYNTFGINPSTESDQYNEPWGIGEHKFKIFVFGKMLSLSVTIIENPVKSIEALPITILEKTYSHYENGKIYYDYEDLVKIRVNFKDGTYKDMTRDEYRNIVDGTYVYCSSEQHTSAWETGNSYTYKLMSDGNVIAEGTVNIVKNPYISMEIISLPKDEYSAGEAFKIDGTVVRLHTSEDSTADEPLDITLSNNSEYYQYGTVRANGIEFNYSVNDVTLTVSGLDLSAQRIINYSDVTVKNIEMLKAPITKEGLGMSFRLEMSDGNVRTVTASRNIQSLGYNYYNDTLTVSGYFDTQYGMYGFSILYNSENEDYDKVTVSFCGKDFDLSPEDVEKIRIEALANALLYFSAFGDYEGYNYNGTVSEENIDLIFDCLAYGNFIAQKYSENNDYEYLDAAELTKAIKKYFNCADFDITKFSGYNSSDNTYRNYNANGMGTEFETETVVSSLDNSVSGSLEYIFNCDNRTVAAKAVVKNGKISSTSQLFDHGDANGDGVLDIKDLVRMKKALVNKDNINCTPLVADMNIDTVVNAEDVAILRKILLGVQ